MTRTRYPDAEWIKWFAWHPVWIKGHGPVWLRTIERKLVETYDSTSVEGAPCTRYVYEYCLLEITDDNSK